MSYTAYTRAHGTNSTYVQGCRCAACREAARQYLAQHRRQKKQAPTPTGISQLISAPEPSVERRVTGISGMTTSSVLTSSGVKVWCRCGNTGYANKWIVGKSRRVEKCEACR